ncbi:unknown [Prevotella sp. CAG:732]|nr:unknown [Prevotella sp. CAG:732]
MIADDFYDLDIIDTIRVVKHLLFSNKKKGWMHHCAQPRTKLESYKKSSIC